MTTVATNPLKVRSTVPRVLVVDDEREVVELLGEALTRDLSCRVSGAASVEEAEEYIEREQVDLMIVDLRLPDGDGASLLAALRRRHPLASAIVMTGAPSVDRAVAAIRGGASDFLPKPFTIDELLRRTQAALQRHAVLVKSQGRLGRLRQAVRQLNTARRQVTRKVDLLCNDLVSAYGELSRQLDTVRSSESFRTTINSASDLEQMLCHAMDWMLRQMGYANVAIWLAGEDGFQLGAYMKYTIPGESALVNAMNQSLLPMLVRDGLVSLADESALKALSAQEQQHLRGQCVLGTHCTYLGESLAHIVLFREQGKPFTEDDIITLKIIGPVFAVALATMVKRAEEEADDGFEGSSDGPLMDDEDSERRKPRKKDDADWWKRGEQPPF